MQVVIQATSDGATPRRVQIRGEQVVKVGSSGWADLCVTGDDGLAEVHFEVSCTPEGCKVRGLSAAAPTLVNNEVIASAIVYDGDIVRAGRSQFTLVIQGGPSRPQPDASADEPSAVVAAAVLPAAAAAAAMGLVGVCDYLEFGSGIKPLATKAASADELIGQLAEQEKFQDAIKLRAYLLSKPAAIWWGCLCLRDELGADLPPQQVAAIDAAALWVSEGEESQRRAAEARAADAMYSGPGATLALAAFWSTGSLAPEGSPDVEPEERLTAQGVTAALVMAAHASPPGKSTDRFNTFLETGRGIAAGEIAVPSKAE